MAARRLGDQNDISVSSQLELDLAARCNSQVLAHGLGYRDLAFCGDGRDQGTSGSTNLLKGIIQPALKQGSQ